MKTLVAFFTVAGVLLLVSASAPAQQGDPQKKIDPDELKKQPDKKAAPKLDLDQFKKMIEQIGGGIGSDPDQLKKLMEQIGGFADPDQLKKMIEQIGGKGGIGGVVDPDQLKKMMEKIGGKGGIADPEQLKKMIEQIGGKGGIVDPDAIKKQLDKLGKGGGELIVDKTTVQVGPNGEITVIQQMRIVMPGDKKDDGKDKK
ncbi:MAG TPA: hypothetical protein VE988_16720 [Gemmataceae bacterium]|nr:hypothetical protein [Gemmataceae bacterium]